MTPAALRTIAEWHRWLALYCRAWGAHDAARECSREADRFTAAAERMEKDDG